MSVTNNKIICEHTFGSVIVYENIYSIGSFCINKIITSETCFVHMVEKEKTKRKKKKMKQQKQTNRN